MTLFLSLIAQFLHIGLMIAAAPTVAGALDWLDSRLSRRSGIPILLPWHDLVRLSRKTPMTQDSVSVASDLAVALGFGATLAAAALVPSFTLGMAFAPLADILVIVSSLTMARAAACLAALDSGTALPGLAAQNASARAVLAEPALMLTVVALALTDGSFNIDQISGQQREGLLPPAESTAVALAAVLVLVFAEASVPAGALDHMASGRGLAISRMTGWIRRVVWIDLMAALFLPAGMAAAGSSPLVWLVGLAAWGVKLGAFVAALAAIQTFWGRVEHCGLPAMIGVAAVLALLATVMVLASAGTA